MTHDFSKFPKYDGKESRVVTVFGWSRTEKDTPQWAEGERLGRLCVERGFSVRTGGYCGTMESVSKGAREALDAGAAAATAAASDAAADGAAPRCEVIGVTVNGMFPDRVTVGNQFLTTQIDAPTFPRRVEMLCNDCRYYVALPGTLGTAHELVTVWILSLLQHATLDRPLIFVTREPWGRWVEMTASILNLPANNAALIRVVDTVDEIVDAIVADDAARRPAAAA